MMTIFPLFAARNYGVWTVMDVVLTTVKLLKNPNLN